MTCRGSHLVAQNEVKQEQQPAEIPNILQRLQRLEEIVLRQNSSLLSGFNDDGPPAKRVALTPTSVDASAAVPEVDQARDEDSTALENVGTREDFLVSFSNDVQLNSV